eukprot:sb/3460806/
MVLHNRIKEFEGLIQYIEVQASYEASAERPNSVAWEVPVSAIKQPSLPFPPNGDPQLFYYPYLPPQPYQYQVPGPPYPPPMLDPNVVAVPGVNSNNSHPSLLPPLLSLVVVIRRRVTVERGTGQGHDGYKPKSKLDTLDPPQEMPTPGSTSSEQKKSPPPPQKASSPTKKEATPQITEDSPVETPSPAEAASTQQSPEIPASQTVEVGKDEPKAVESEVVNHIAETIPDSTSNAVQESDKKDVDIIEEKIPAEKIKKEKHEVKEEVTQEEKQEIIGESAENSVVDAETKQGVLTNGEVVLEEEKTPTKTAKEENSLPCDEAATESKEMKVSGEAEGTKPRGDTESSESFSLKHNTSGDLNEKLEEAINDNSSTEQPPVLDGPATSASNTSEVDGTATTASTTSEADGPTTSTISELDGPATTTTDNSAIVIPNSPEKGNWTMVSSGALSSSSSDNFVHVGSDGSAHSLPTSPDVSERKEEEPPTREKTVVPAGGEVVPVKRKKKESGNKVAGKPPTPPSAVTKPTKEQPPVKAARAVKVSASSADGDSKEVDVLSESGLSTMSSSSVHSCISLPTNPLARSTSWADLVRKGKSDSPPVTAPKKQVSSKSAASKYQSTPSRYLSHVQQAPETTTKKQVTVSKSRSLPLSSKPARPPKTSHIGEDGWSVSSGKSRVKTIPNKGQPEPKPGKSTTDTIGRTGKTASPHLTQRAVKPRTGEVKSKVAGDKSKPDIGSRTKSSDSIEKARPSRATVPKSRPVPSKPVSKPSSTTPKPVKKTLTASKPLSKPSTTTSKPLSKARSLDGANKLDPTKSSKGISKSSDSLDKTGKKKEEPKGKKTTSTTTTNPPAATPPTTLTVDTTEEILSDVITPATEDGITPLIEDLEREISFECKSIQTETINEEYSYYPTSEIKDLQEQQEKERAARAMVHAEKLARAEQLRDQKIAEVKRKAQEEDMKVNEIAFINSLEAQNRKMELLGKEQQAEAKRAEIQVRQKEVRKRRSEELHAKEEAVLGRKQAIEADRLARIASIEDKIRVSQERTSESAAAAQCGNGYLQVSNRDPPSHQVDLNKLEMERGAREKALEREVMREFIRHDRGGDKKSVSSSTLKEMQEKAAMLCRNLVPDYLPAHTLYDPPKWCSACNVKIVSEAVLMGHMIKRHQRSTEDEAEKESQFIVNYTDDLCPLTQDNVTRQKILRKRAKKVKTRIVNKIPELPAIKLLETGLECPNRNRLTKCIKAMGNVKTREKGLGDLSRTVMTRNDVNHLLEKGVLEQLCGLLSDSKLIAPVSKLLLHSCTLSSTGAQICSRYLPDVVESLTVTPAATLPAVHVDLTRLTTALIRSLTPCEPLTVDMISFLVCKEVIDVINETCTRTTWIKEGMSPSITPLPQSVLDSEGMSLELRHVCNYLLTCATHNNYNTVLDMCIQLIGYVVFSHPSNQILLQNGPSPSILQLLTSLPFSYFSDVSIPQPMTSSFFRQSQITFLQGERQGHQNIMQCLVKRIKMLENALREASTTFSLSDYISLTLSFSLSLPLSLSLSLSLSLPPSFYISISPAAIAENGKFLHATCPLTKDVEFLA